MYRGSRRPPGLAVAGALIPIIAGGTPILAGERASNDERNIMNADAATTSHAHTNRLINATSPYLLQHAHNPVDWYPWGPEALEKARAENKPIFLSIGYAACHWCHVMERESFENEEIAAILNQQYVPIKVDREERPDLDDLYMSATILYNRGSGGWPMSVFLTPDQKPFFAGTYFPPSSRGSMPGFKEVLLHIARLWQEERRQISESAEALSGAISQFGALAADDGGIPRETVSQVANQLAGAFDRNTGGLASGRNKFPPSMTMSLMLREYERTRRQGKPNAFLLEMVELTLDHMARGGIYDHLAGGIARYSTDPQWLVPHFEKMLYDQALVSRIYLEAAQLTGRDRYLGVARDILDYVLADLRSPGGGFYSTRDADSEGVEGKYYVWTRREVMEILGEEAGPLFCSYYDVTDAGNWEGNNILNVQRDLGTVARLNDVEPARLQEVLAESRDTLLKARSKRVPPGLDDKILTSWNGLMIAAFARGARVTGDTRYSQAAARAAGFVLKELSRDGRLLRTYRKGKAHTGGYLDDYAFFVEGLIELYEATFDRRWLGEALRLNDRMIELFWDGEGGAFFFVADDAEQLLVRAKDIRDSAVPSGNSVAMMNLLRLGRLLNRVDLIEKAEGTMRAVAGSVAESPFGHERLLAAVDFCRAENREVVLVGSRDDKRLHALAIALAEVYAPNTLVAHIDPDAPGADDLRKRVPLLEGKTLVDSSPAAYVCVNRTCQRPVSSPEELTGQLR
jgi:uncharacterized protein YyaL (SSP411 family)